MNLFIFYCTILLFCIICYEDITTMYIHDRYFVLLFLCNISYFRINVSKTVLFLFLLVLIFFAYKEMLGGADVKLFLFNFLSFGFYQNMIIIQISTLFALCYMFLYKKQKIPFLPFLSLGILCSYFFL
ncbi:MAG: prepilin peptidase [Breznakia sp.]